MFHFSMMYKYCVCITFVPEVATWACSWHGIKIQSQTNWLYQFNLNRLPLPPGSFSTLWNADERFKETYFTEKAVSRYRTAVRFKASALSLALDPTFGIHSHKTLDTVQPCHLLKPNWKPSSSHSISILTNISTQFLLQSMCACVCVCVCVRVCSAFLLLLLLFILLLLLFLNNTLCKLFW